MYFALENHLQCFTIDSYVDHVVPHYPLSCLCDVEVTSFVESYNPILLIVQYQSRELVLDRARTMSQMSQLISNGRTTLV